MIELEDIFAEVGITQYLEAFIEHGFDTWDSIQDITESDLDVLGVKLGHRRKLQRRIANSRGLSQDLALASPTRTGPIDDRPPDEQKGSAVKVEGRDVGFASGIDSQIASQIASGIASGPQGAKRKYRRHPKPDENAPDRPPSAYVIFSNRMREDLKGKNMSFTEIAKLVGEKWQGLPAPEKEPYEQQASTAKERYNAELTAYKKTHNFAEYSQYLAAFKARQSNQQQVTDLDVPKRPKLENHTHAESSTATSSSVSQRGGNSPPTHMPGDPPVAISTPWTPLENHTGGSLTLPAVYPGTRRGSPGSPSNVLPGYLQTVFLDSAQSLPWREGSREQRSMPLQQRRRVSSIGDRPAGYSSPPVGDSLSMTDALQPVRRMGPVPHPPSTSASVPPHSASSSAYLSSRSPLEHPLERSHSIPSLFSRVSPGSYDNQHNYLPPLQPSSLSPQSRAQGPQQPSSNMEEYPTSITSMHGHPRNNSPRGGSADNNDPRRREFGSPEDNNSDRFSTLVRAASEVNNQNSRGKPPN